MSQGIEPMTAAEYRGTFVANSPLTRRVLAALEEWEANLAHARLGSLVAAIREHPMASKITQLNIKISGRDVDWGQALLDEALSHLDSLLPKEPEVVVGPSSQSYRVNEGRVEVQFPRFPGWRSTRGIYIPVEDAPVVAALLAGGGK